MVTIVIPTFDRHQEVLETLTSIRQILPAAFRVIVLDNCSATIVESHVRASWGIIPENFTFLRNRANIGMSANICRCFEVVETEWCWVLGDTDVPNADSFKLIEKNINNISEGISHIVTSTELFKYVDRRSAKGNCEIWGSLRSGYEFSNLLFISAGIHRTSVMRQYLRDGCHWASSLAPHVAMMIRSSSAGAGFLFCPDQIVTWRPTPKAKRWGVYVLLSGLPLLYEVQGVDNHVRSALKHCMVHHFPRYWLALLDALNSRRDGGFSLGRIYLRLAGCMGPYGFLKYGSIAAVAFLTYSLPLYGRFLDFLCSIVQRLGVSERVAILLFCRQTARNDSART